MSIFAAAVEPLVGVESLVLPIGSVIAVGVFVWWAADHLRKMRGELRSECQKLLEERCTVLDKTLEGLKDTHEGRIRSLETTNAAFLVVRDQMGNFREDVKTEFKDLREKRDEDMRRIDDRFVQLIRGIKYVVPDDEGDRRVRSARDRD